MAFRLNSNEKLYFEKRKGRPTLSRSKESSGGSFAKVYISIIPFLIFELLAEWKLRLPLGGAFFPLGYLFFWAIFFTYYEPKNLEKKFIYYEDNFSLAQVFPLLITALIWFVRFLFLDTFNFLFFGKKYTTIRKARQVSVRVVERLEPPKPTFPKDFVDSLQLLGLSAETTKEWALVHRQYRALAKKLHPDLNPALTQSGNRFIKIDKAYKQLEKYKNIYLK